MSKTKLGDKWECSACGARFYDFGKPEIVCPQCGTDQQAAEEDENVKSRSAEAEPESIEEKDDSDAEDEVAEDAEDLEGDEEEEEEEEEEETIEDERGGLNLGTDDLDDEEEEEEDSDDYDYD